MKIKLISCWFTTSYGAYTDALRTSIEKKVGKEVGIIASNCGCGDPVEVMRKFQSNRCDYFEFPNVQYYKSSRPWKYWLRMRALNVLSRQRAKRYRALAADAQILHFQQTLNAYGSSVVFNWLTSPSQAAKVVTVHELDPYQNDFPENNKLYNKADGIIVHTADMKQSLVDYGVSADLINIIPHGVTIRPLEKSKRDGIIFYAGHKMHTGKGADTLFKAMALLKKKLGPRTPILKIHGHYGTTVPEFGQLLAKEIGISENIRWLNQISVEETMLEYQQALVCVLPYTGSFAGFPAVNAMANELPVVATRRAGLPEHLGDTGVWIRENDPEDLASKISELLQNDELRRELSLRARQRAELFFNWDTIAEKTIAVYQKALQRKNGSE